MAEKKKKETEPIAKNRRATFDYEVSERFEAGISLLGSEVKSMRDGKVDIVDAYVQVENGQAWLKQLNVAPFTQANAFPHELRRPRKLLLHKREIENIERATTREGFTAIPLELYFREGRVKVVIALAKGKKTHDKRAALAKKTADREARAAVVRGRRGE